MISTCEYCSFGNCRIWSTSAGNCNFFFFDTASLQRKKGKLLYSIWSFGFGGNVMKCWSKSWSLFAPPSWDSELHGELSGSRLWHISVLRQQLLRARRPGPHLPHAAAQRRQLRLTGGDKFLIAPSSPRRDEPGEQLAWLPALLAEPFPTCSRLTREILGRVFFFWIASVI